MILSLASPAEKFYGLDMSWGRLTFGVCSVAAVPLVLDKSRVKLIINAGRGAGESEGRTSWTGKPELGDYVSFYGFMLYYLSLLGEVPSATSRTEEGKDDQGKGQGEGSDELRLILGGYSYGSLVASHLPEVDVVRDLFGSASSDDTGTMGTIRQTAHRIYSRTVEEGFGHPLQQGSGTTGLPNVIPKTTVSYLLISPLLPPISLFLTLFTKFSLEVGMETSAQGRQISCPKPADQFIANPTLVIYGNEDAFTSASKVRKWADDIFRASRGRFEAHEVDGASHFWREDGVESQARGLLRDWLS